jgi:hypothetical protein
MGALSFRGGGECGDLFAVGLFAKAGVSWMGEFEGKGILRFAQGDTDFMGFAGMGFLLP